VIKALRTEEENQAIESNLFPTARAVVRERINFPWHRDESGVSAASRAVSSQAMALDVFETVRRLDARDDIVGAWARELQPALPSDGAWTIDTEYLVQKDLLGEPRSTQVDALIRSAHALIVCECKFTETSGGACSQPKPIANGANKGKRQCNGRYEMQQNPVNRRWSRCALTGKGIRYWNVIPNVLEISDEMDHASCPVAGEWYQWMRNLVVARELGRQESKTPAFLLVYAAGRFPMAEKVRLAEWKKWEATVKQSEVPMMTVSYQRLLKIGISVAGHGERKILNQLSEWIDRKISIGEPKHA